MMTKCGRSVPVDLELNYLSRLVDQFFKILPLRENGEPTLPEFMRSLQVEMIGNRSLILLISCDSMYMTLLSILQYLIDNDCEVAVVKREVFKAISICKKLREKYAAMEV